MAQTIQEFIQSGEHLEIGTVDPKTKIAPLTRDGKPIYITLAKSPTLGTPFSPYPSYDGGERTSLDLRTPPELEQVAEYIDEIIQRQVLADPQKFYARPPKSLADNYNSLHRPPSKAGYTGTFRTKCSFREKSASFRAFDLEARKTLTVNELKSLDWTSAELAIVARLSGVYFQASGFGPIMNLQTVGIRASSSECPFDFIECGQ